MVNRYIENPCSPYRSPMYPDAWGTRLQSVLLSLEKSLASVKTYKGAEALMASKGSDRGKSTGCPRSYYDLENDSTNFRAQ